ncbi:DUF3300 domain-containing protein [Ensifer adhaerens]|uniref:DUF3300 domain-containing protein n=1 Tax=Ensifer adhaerens TaxID=106592 RepID=UPI003D02E281
MTMRLLRILGIGAVASLIAITPILEPLASAQNARAPEESATQDDTTDQLTDAELEVLVARIALYPDELIALICSASLFPLQIVQAGRFLEESKSDKDLKPKESWDGSIVSLLNYPDVVKNMNDDLDWTEALGNALAYQQQDVLLAIQSLRDKAVADNVIKSDDKITVNVENDNVIIQPKDPEKVYVPQYEPQMLYEPGYAVRPIEYYPDYYPNYYYPSAPFFAAAVTGAVWASAVDWDDGGVWGGHWDGGDIDIDCNKCFNHIDINGKFKLNDIDWKNVDRSKIHFDKNKLANIDRDKFKSNVKEFRKNNLADKARDIRKGRDVSKRDRVRDKISVNDIRKSKVDAGRIKRGMANSNIDRKKVGENIRAKAPGKAKIGSGNRHQISRDKGKISHHISKPRPGGHAMRPAHHKRPSAFGKVGNGHRAKISSHRGHKAMGGGHRGGGKHKSIRRHGGRHHR